MHSICELNCKKAWRLPIIKVETCSLAYIKKQLCSKYNSVLYFTGTLVAHRDVIRQNINIKAGWKQ